MRGAFLVLAMVLATPLIAEGQGRPALRVERADGSVQSVAVRADQGFAAVPSELFTQLGWSVASRAARLTLSVPGEIEITLNAGSPFFLWDGVALQMTDPPYLSGGSMLLPVQLLTDFLPRRLPDLYEFDGPTGTLRAGDPADRSGAPNSSAPTSAPSGTATTGSSGAGSSASVEPPRSGGEPLPVSSDRSLYDGPRVVIIDAGHGGADPGALGPDGIREKDVALGIALKVAEALRSEAGVEVHMTRDDDTFVDIWQRGEVATELKGERPGIFVSIHANSFPARRAASGFETYFLSEARTEHERRVAAIENAPISFQGQDVASGDDSDLGFILRELTNLDHAHWSALLAEFVQDELDDFHPGPNRGVKQGVLAVLTNALMPSVLVEVGYLSNTDEGRLLGQSGFHGDAAVAIAEAVMTFFERYPPGSDFGGREER